jgi:hypothetical protein
VLARQHLLEVHRTWGGVWWQRGILNVTSDFETDASPGGEATCCSTEGADFVVEMHSPLFAALCRHAHRRRRRLTTNPTAGRQALHARGARGMAHQRRDSRGPGAEGAAWVPITQEETSVHAPPDRDSSTSPALQMVRARLCASDCMCGHAQSPGRYIRERA